MANYWSTFLSPPVITRLVSRPFPCSLLSLWSLVLSGCDIPFWKAFDKPHKTLGADLITCIDN